MLELDRSVASPVITLLNAPLFATVSQILGNLKKTRGVLSREFFFCLADDVASRLRLAPYASLKIERRMAAIVAIDFRNRPSKDTQVTRSRRVVDRNRFDRVSRCAGSEKHFATFGEESC